MKRILAVFASVALFSGCSMLASNPPPRIDAPPAEGPPEEGTQATAAPKPPGQEIPGSWASKAASGPGSEKVRKVEMIFEDGGVFAGTMLVDDDGKKRFVSLEGTWQKREGNLVVTLSDGSVLTWASSLDGNTLILKDGEAELQLERMPE